MHVREFVSNIQSDRERKIVGKRGASSDEVDRSQFKSLWVSANWAYSVLLEFDGSGVA